MPVNITEKLVPYLVPASPDKYIKKGSEPQFWPARFGHIRYLIDQMNLTFGLITITYAEAIELLKNREVMVGGTYYITDWPTYTFDTVTDNKDIGKGVYTTGVAEDAFSQECIGAVLVPPYSNVFDADWSGVDEASGINFFSYQGTWDIARAAYFIGEVVTYNGRNWICKSNTNPAVPSPLPYTSRTSANRPPINTAKWQLLPLAENCGMLVEYDPMDIVFNKNTSGVYLGTYSILCRRDKRQNIIQNAPPAVAGSFIGLNNTRSFKWGCNGVLNWNVDRTSLVVNHNDHNGFGGDADQLFITLTNDGRFFDTEIDGNVFRVTLTNQCGIASIQNTRLTRINASSSSQLVASSAFFQIKGAAPGQRPNFNTITMSGSSIYNVTGGGAGSILFDWATINQCTIGNFNLVGGTLPYGLAYFTNVVRRNYFENLFLDFQNNFIFTLQPFFYNNSAQEYRGLNITNSDNNLHGFVNMATAYDLGTKTLTLPAGYSRLGEIWLLNANGEEIEKVAGMSTQEYEAGTKFRVVTGTSVTFKVRAKVGYVPTPGNANWGIMGTADATLTLNGAIGYIEYVHIKNNSDYVRIVDTNIFV